MLGFDRAGVGRRHHDTAMDARYARARELPRRVLLDQQRRPERGNDDDLDRRTDRHHGRDRRPRRLPEPALQRLAVRLDRRQLSADDGDRHHRDDRQTRRSRRLEGRPQVFRRRVRRSDRHHLRVHGEQHLGIFQYGQRAAGAAERDDDRGDGDHHHQRDVQRHGERQRLDDDGDLRLRPRYELRHEYRRHPFEHSGEHGQHGRLGDACRGAHLRHDVSLPRQREQRRRRHGQRQRHELLHARLPRAGARRDDRGSDQHHCDDGHTQRRHQRQRRDDGRVVRLRQNHQLRLERQRHSESTAGQCEQCVGDGEHLRPRLRYAVSFPRRGVQRRRRHGDARQRSDLHYLGVSRAHRRHPGRDERDHQFDHVQRQRHGERQRCDGRLRLRP